ncbi:MAG TPA: OsmC family protein [Vicinamibacterales bacterium]
MSETFVSHLDWSGAAKGATHDPATFSRDLELTLGGMTLPLSSAPAYRGDASRLNPEQLLVGALSACQALTYLFLAARKQVIVVGYVDEAEGTLEMVDGRVRMSRVTLRPRITLEGVADEPEAGPLVERARELVAKAHNGCFIANSVTSNVEIEPTFVFSEAAVRTAP